MLLNAFLESADRHAAKLAVGDIQRDVTYGQLTVLAAAMKRVIEAQTDRPAVGVLLPSTAAFVAGFYGGLWARRAIVPLNFLLQARELAAIIRDAGIDVVLTCKYFEDLMAELPARGVMLEDLGLKWRYLAARLRPRPKVPQVDPEEIAVILYTSGTAGQPKGVCLSHRNLHADTFGCIEHLRMNADQNFLGVLPLFHTFGLTATLLAPSLLGATVLYQARFQPAEVIRKLKDGRISILLAIPSMYAAILNAKSVTPEAFEHMVLAVSGGEPLSPALTQRYARELGVTLLEGYGLTEAAPVVSVSQPWSNRPGTVGLPLPKVEVKTVDDEGREATRSGAGELCVRGPTIMKGYYNRPEETAAAVDANGWLHTGDLATIDADGYVSITGRKKDMIIVGGENVYPREIEAVLDEHPAVVQSAVIGVQDASRGEVVIGFVVPRDGAEITPIALRSYCRERLAGYKVPRDIVIDRDLPKGPTGKVLKRMLRERYAPVAS